MTADWSNPMTGGDGGDVGRNCGRRNEIGPVPKSMKRDCWILPVFGALAGAVYRNPLHKKKGS
jgi:hypothetical protein